MVRKREDEAAAMRETLDLLDRAKAAGFLVKDIAGMLGVTPQQASTYRNHAMPLNSRRVLKSLLDAEERKEAGGLLYPSQQTAAEHDNVERLFQLTGARGPLWKMYHELALSIIKLAEETGPDAGTSDSDPKA